MLDRVFEEELKKIVSIKNIKTSYADGKLNYKIFAIHRELGEVILKFSTLFNVNEIKVDEYGWDVLKCVKAYIRNVIVANEQGLMFTIEQIKRDVISDK